MGLVAARDIQSVPRDRWPELTVADVMIPFEQMRTVEPAAPAERVLAIMGRDGPNQLPVVAGGRLLGIVTREHLLRLLATRLEFGG